MSTPNFVPCVKRITMIKFECDKSTPTRSSNGVKVLLIDDEFSFFACTFLNIIVTKKNLQNHYHSTIYFLDKDFL